MNFLRQFFYGRYGRDHLNMALVFLAVALSFLSRFFLGNILMMVSYGIVALFLFRALSRNIPRRQAENALFLEATRGLRNRVSQGGNSAGFGGGGGQKVKKDRANYRYFKCPGCKQAMRIPRGRGKVRVTCSKCDMQFNKKV